MGVGGALLGTLLTWGLTALGSALVFVVPNTNKALEQTILDGSLGFAAGVMLAASFWSLLAPAIEMASTFGGYSESAAFVPAAVGFVVGALFVYLCDKMVPESTEQSFFAIDKKRDGENAESTAFDRASRLEEDGLRRRFGESRSTSPPLRRSPQQTAQRRMFRRMLLLVIAITVHNFPEGLAVGVGFGAVGMSESATLAKAWNLAIGIGIQNFPEGFAVSMPLHRAGMSAFRSFWIGQLSGAVEPVAGVLGALLVSHARFVLPYALGFAAGAMVFVVMNDLIPEATKSGHTTLPSFGAILGFVVMMSLDVAFG